MKLKISRLFHWLYATLMFLPILMFLPSCLYFAFNEHATNTETTTINYKYESNEVNSLSDLIIGNIYEFNLNGYAIDDFISEDNYINFQLLSDLDIQYQSLILDNTFENLYKFTPNTILGLFADADNTYIGTSYDFENFQASDYDIVYQYNATFTSNCYILLLDYDEYFNGWDYLEYTDYNVIESVTTNVEQTIPQQINNAWNSVWNLPVFSWTQNSFITAPFSYITALFGLSSDNSLNYVFTYFASISICWLVFDLIMYVPNLAHRWLDRSAIE